MATLSIALRFRDVASGIDTIAEHRKIITRNGSVWWGWWKKAFESEASERELCLLEGESCFLVDRQTQRMFVAEILECVRGPLDNGETAHIPEYYRGQAKQVYAWFRFGDIKSCDYLPRVSNRFADDTLIWLNRPESASREAEPKSTPNGNKVLHLSDLHFGGDYGFRPPGVRKEIGERKCTLTECIVEDLRRLKCNDEIAAIILTGDVVTAGNWSDEVRGQAITELRNLCSSLNVSIDRLIVLPGNHDVVRYPDSSNASAATLAIQSQVSYAHERDFRLFMDELTGRGWKESLQYHRSINCRDSELLFCLLNSCTILATEWTEYGYVGDLGIEAIRKATPTSQSRPIYRILAMHHHLLPVNSVAAPQSKGVTLALDANRILNEALASGFQIALHGHEHQPRIAKYGAFPLMGAPPTGEIVIVSNGSTGVAAKRLPGNERNSYCLFDFGAEEAVVTLRELRPDGIAGSSLFDGSIGVRPNT